MQAAASAGVNAVENKNGRERTFNQSIKFCFPATYPPITPIAFDNVPIWKSTLSERPKCFTVPAPFPSTPEPCASSTYVIKSNSSAISTISGSFATSPSIEKTPSVITINLL
ncbi:Uncharacterised protein [Streptococcus pneumoniae]|nr:Uncharacterised protein [Streptococcus pneumoniae]